MEVVAQEKSAKNPGIVDVVHDEDDEDEEMMEYMVTATEVVSSDEPLPEPTAAPAKRPNLLMKLMNDADEETVKEAADAVTTALPRVVMDTSVQSSDESSTIGEAMSAAPSVTVVEEVVIAMDDDEPSWLEKKLGPWVARHRTSLHMWLIALLVVYVSLFASIIFQRGLRGLGEWSMASVVRDSLWAVLMGLIVLLAIGKHY